MDPQIRHNRTAWESASVKYVREDAALLAVARAGTSLFPAERAVLAPLLRTAPLVVHLLSGNGTDDVALADAGAARVIGVDFSAVTTRAAQRRADDAGAACTYLLSTVPGVPLRDGCADLVYTGKGALIWMRDLGAWAAEVARLLRPGGHLFVYEAHPAVPLWTWDPDAPRIREDRSYFGRSFVNDTFPAHGAVQFQWTLGDIVTAVAAAGLRVHSLTEYAEPFYRWGGVDAAAWHGRLPNAFSLLAARPG